MRLAIIDYGSGNLHSAAKAFERVAGAEWEVRVTSRAEDLQNASHIVLPGVGAFGDCMSGLTRLGGMRQAMEREVRERGKPFLGICVGMQLLADRGYEHGEHEGLGWLPGEVRKLPEAPGVKIPHMGWNTLEIKRDHPVLSGISSGAHVYFVHSYRFISKDSLNIIAETEHGGPVVAALAHHNIAAAQFHPEKSQETGLQFLANFLAWKP